MASSPFCKIACISGQSRRLLMPSRYTYPDSPAIFRLANPSCSSQKVETGTSVTKASTTPKAACRRPTRVLGTGSIMAPGQRVRRYSSAA